ncbi:hypothetical protein N7535_003828 [Penicillium sp. DV-2018c]|nr:hypothetical protein N7535_003828 [Penicillium sp. DV-2018c]
MSAQKVVVIGATGLQGSSVVTELLKNPATYKVRAVTRDPTKDSAQKLAKQGAELWQGDLSDPQSLELAFADADVIYAMTDFWQSMSGEVEFSQGKSIVDIADRVTTLQHFIWSALPDPVQLSRGRFLNVHHWKSKSNVTEYIREAKPMLWAKTTTILFPNYFENCLTVPSLYLPLKEKGGAGYIRAFPHGPDTVMPNAAIADTGKLVVEILSDRQRYYKKTIAFYSEALSEAEKMKTLGQILDIPVQYQQISSAEFQRKLERDMPAEIALDFTEQIMIFEEFGNVYGSDDFIQAHQIQGLSLQSWSDFVQSHDLRSKMVGEVDDMAHRNSFPKAS